MLPTVGTCLGSNSLITLLSLDWANAELGLGLEFKNLWKAELDISNILLFIYGIVTLDNTTHDTSRSIHIDLVEVGGLVTPAIRQVEYHNRHKLAGQAKLREIINKVLESGRKLDWVSAYGDSIRRVFASSPGELLSRRQPENDHLQQDRDNLDLEDVLDTSVEV